MTASVPESNGNIRRQKLGEEILNAITHGLGALLAIAGLVLLVVRAARYGTAVNVVSVTLFGSTMILLYLCSCLYHALADNKGKRVFQVLDHCTIFLLILGTYIPICLVNLGGALGWTLFGVNTACAVVGIVLTAVDMKRWKKVSMVLYVVMGWMCLIALPAIYRALTPMGFVFLALGGVCYTVGILFYRQKEKLYRHGIWHIFVLAGTIFQFFTVYTNCCF
ncbi:MAG: hemolysin III family protein [Ruminiclostridium sp.]|nr:hemolysin III family protein [Ruminiclostridium sp.]